MGTEGKRWSNFRMAQWSESREIWREAKRHYVIKNRNGQLKKLAIQKSFSCFFCKSFFGVDSERESECATTLHPVWLRNIRTFEPFFLVISLAGFECTWCRRDVFRYVIIWWIAFFLWRPSKQPRCLHSIGFLLYHPLNVWHCNSLKEFIQAGECFEASFFSIHQQVFLLQTPPGSKMM